MSGPISLTMQDRLQLQAIPPGAANIVLDNVENLNAALEAEQVTPGQVVAAMDALQAVVRRCLGKGG